MYGTIFLHFRTVLYINKKGLRAGTSIFRHLCFEFRQFFKRYQVRVPFKGPPTQLMTSHPSVVGGWCGRFAGAGTRGGWRGCVKGGVRVNGGGSWRVAGAAQL